ncbi:MAG: MATE family efflux transporter [Planctomycetota bacterium]
MSRSKAQPPRLNRALLRLAVPLLFANLAQTMLSWVDTAMVGRLGKNALAAMGPASVFFLVLFLIFSAGFMGIQTLCARRFGEQKLDVVGQVFTNGLGVSILVGLFAGALGIVAAEPVANFLVGDASIASMTAEYLSWRWGAVITLTTLWAYKGFFFGIGVTWFDMYLAFAMNLLNILLNWIFIFGHWGAPEMGLAGAALASVLATAFAASSYMIFSLQKKYRLRFSLYRGGINRDLLGRIFKLSLPRALSGFAFGAAILYFKLIGDHAGTTALAASTVIWRFFGTTVLVSLAIGTATATLVGQRLGANDPEGADATARAAVKLGVLLTGSVSLIVIFFPQLILGWFSQDTAVVSVGTPALRLVGIFIVIDSAGIIMSRTLSAAGCVVYVMSMEFVVSLGCMLTTAFFLTKYFPDNLTVIWCSWVVYILCWYTAMATKFLAGGWKTVKI